MKINEVIKRRRIKLGISENKIIEQTSITIDHYSDIEQYENEINTTVKLCDVRKIFAKLKLNILDIFNIENIIPINQDNSIELKRNKIVKLEREKLGMTQEQLGDRLGFETEIIIEMESNEDFLENWVLCNIMELSAVLNIPIAKLILC